MRKITKNFYEYEFYQTNKVYLREQNKKYMYDNKEVINNIYQVVVFQLQPIRDYFNKFVSPTSAVRCPVLNKKVGGVSTSDHLTGSAVDFVVIGADMAKVFKELKDATWLEYGQLIYYKDKGFIHISLPTRDNYREAFIK